MEEQHSTALVLSLISLIAVSGVIVFFSSPELTGSSTYQPIPLAGGVKGQPDPHTQYINIDDGVCRLYVAKPVTFITWMDHECKELNHGRQKREGDCRYQAQLEVDLKCRRAPVFENLQPPQYITGQVPVDPVSCSTLAANYDNILLQTSARERPPLQTISLINPCTGSAEAATRQAWTAIAPLRDHVRTVFSKGDTMGYVDGETNAQGNIKYVNCVNGASLVIVSGVPVCNTI